MPPKPSCAQCKKKIEDKHFFRCSQCKRCYDLTCSNTEKLFDLMDKERKSLWTCLKCRQSTKVQPRKASTPITTKRCAVTASNCNQFEMKSRDGPQKKTFHTALPQLHQQQLDSSLDNITVRKYNVAVQNSFESLSDEELDISILRNNTLNRSCPDLTANYKDEVEILKSKIEELQEQLKFSDNYSTKLLMENEKLKKQISDCSLQINHLKDICKSTPINVKPAKGMVKIDQASQTSVKKTPKNKCKVVTQLNIKNSTEISHCSETPEDASENGMQNVLDLSGSLKTSPKNIYILGGRQSKGLATALLKSRERTTYEKYDVTATIKPNARSEDILQSLETSNTNSNDIIIVNIGENDRNPHKLLAELSAFIKMRPEALVIVTSVMISVHLNEQKLNSTLKLLCKSFENCRFVELTDLDKYGNNFTNKLCSKINFIIDSLYYSNKYLSCNKFKLNVNTKVACNNRTTFGISEKLGQCSKSRKTLTQKSITEYFPIKSNSNFFRP